MSDFFRGGMAATLKALIACGAQVAESANCLVIRVGGKTVAFAPKGQYIDLLKHAYKKGFGRHRVTN